MAKLVLKRSSEFMNAARKIGVYIDGSKVGTIKNGGTEVYDVAAGKHTIRAKMDWCGSRDIEFSVGEGETRYMKLTGIPYANPIMLTWAGLFIINLMLVFSSGRNYLFYFTLPFCALLLYYFTMGRNDYLQIKEHDFFQ